MKYIFTLLTFIIGCVPANSPSDSLPRKYYGTIGLYHGDSPVTPLKTISFNLTEKDSMYEGVMADSIKTYHVIGKRKSTDTYYSWWGTRDIFNDPNTAALSDTNMAVFSGNTLTITDMFGGIRYMKAVLHQ